jgi:hypothetical protein
LTVRQPWAHCIATGRKWLESRSWSTHYRGPLAIHAGRGFGVAERMACSQLDIDPAELAFGAIIAVASVIDVLEADEIDLRERMAQWQYCDFNGSRYAWRLGDVRRVDPAALVGGAQGLWSVPGILRFALALRFATLVAD